ncbi:MAG: hypothetical protein AAF441_01355 [Pseudomonadota bacterium]
MSLANVALDDGQGAGARVRGLAEQSLWISVVLPAVVFWAIFAWMNGPSGFEKLLERGPIDNDDLMRLAQIRDLLAGQGFFDLNQARMNAPFGLDMHWSRLVDASVAGLMLLGEQFLGKDLAEPFALTVWPIITLLPAFIALGFISRACGTAGAVLPGLFFAFVATTPNYFFTAGKIDHHNIQMALCLTMVACTLWSRTLPVLAAGAGVIMAVMLSIGLEGLLYALICALWFPVMWMLHGALWARQLTSFAVGLAAGTIATFFGLTYPHTGLTFDCDVISFAYVPAVMFGAFCLTILGERSAWFESPLHRLIGAGAAGALSVLALVLTEAACLGGPYEALTPELKAQWFNNIEETQSILGILAYNKIKAFVKYPYLLIGLAVGGYLVWKALRDGQPERDALIVITLMLAAGTLITLVQVRAATFATFLAVPLFAALAAQIRGGLTTARSPALAAVALACVWVVGSNMAWHAFGAFALGGKRDDPNAIAGDNGCGLPQGLAALKKEEPGVVLNSIYMGPWILSHTRHGAVAGPYHRNEAGILHSRYALSGSAETARQIISSRGARYVMWCAVNGEAQSLTNANPDGLVAQAAKGNIPTWLVPLNDFETSGLRIFKVVPEG